MTKPPRIPTTSDTTSTPPIRTVTMQNLILSLKLASVKKRVWRDVQNPHHFGRCHVKQFPFTIHQFSVQNYLFSFASSGQILDFDI